jgi:hypothetical protein
LCDLCIDDADDIMEVHYTSEGLSYTSDDLVRRGPSGRMCIEDDDRLYVDMPPLRNIEIVSDDDDSIQIITIPHPQIEEITIEEEVDDDDSDVLYLKSVIFIDLTNE